jgi:bifunctional DNA-binding transcriptional regulator/antitoxin component of YhaV-PrlF toxin-antitoxin module
MNELEIKQNSDGDLYFTLPDDLLKRLNWEEGDDLDFTEKDGGFFITKLETQTNK